MHVRGGRRNTMVACGLALATLAAGCSGDSKPKAKPADDSTVAAGGGQSAGATGGFASVDGNLVFSPGFGAPAGVSVRGTASATVPADLAFVVVLPGITDLDSLGTTGAGGVRAADRKAVLDGLAAQGVARTDVSFGAAEDAFGPPRVQVKVPAAQLAAKGPKIVAAIEKTLGRSRSSGASFSVASCEPAAGPIRKQAMQDAETQARALADAGKVSLGAVVALSQDGFVGVGTSPNGCPLVSGSQLEAFDAKPEARLAVSLTVTYALAGAPAGGSAARAILWAGGSATAKAKADEAYVFVVFQSEDDQSTAGPSGADRTRVLDALEKLGIDRKNVQITSRSDYGATTIVQAQTKADGLATAGKDIVRAVEDVLGRSDTSGARFGSSTCDAILAKARKEAMADTRQRGASLAEAAGVKLGAVQSISESTASGADPCDDSIDAILGTDDYTSAPLQPFDAEPELTLTVSAQLGFAVAS